MASAHQPEGLRVFAPFDRMPAETYRVICRAVENTGLRRGRVLYYQGDRPERCWLLLSGSMRGLMYRSDESAVTLGHWSAGDWLGVAECILGSPFLNDTVAEASSALAGFTRTSFQRLLGLPGMREFFLREMARRYYALHSRMELATPLDRLVGYLLDAMEQPAADGAARTGQDAEEQPRLSATQEQIAEAIGASRETVNRHLGQLAARGIIKLGRGSVQVIDAAALAGLSDRGSHERA